MQRQNKLFNMLADYLARRFSVNKDEVVCGTPEGKIVCLAIDNNPKEVKEGGKWNDFIEIDGSIVHFTVVYKKVTDNIVVYNLFVVNGMGIRE